MEQIEASIARYIVNALGDDVFPYYNELPEGFKVPAVYFPERETDSDAESLSSYALEEAWFVQIFAGSDSEAGDMAKHCLKRIVDSHYLIPLVDEEGEKTGRGIRLSGAQTKRIDKGIYQLYVTWDEIYLYGDSEKENPKVQKIKINVKLKEEDDE